MKRSIVALFPADNFINHSLVVELSSLILSCPVPEGAAVANCCILLDPWQLPGSPWEKGTLLFCWWRVKQPCVVVPSLIQCWKPPPGPTPVHAQSSPMHAQSYSCMPNLPLSPSPTTHIYTSAVGVLMTLLHYTETGRSVLLAQHQLSSLSGCLKCALRSWPFSRQYTHTAGHRALNNQVILLEGHWEESEMGSFNLCSLNWSASVFHYCVNCFLCIY